MREIPQNSCSQFGRHLILTLLVVTGVAGCGRAKYEERLQRTVAFYEYLKTIDANLSSAWNRPDMGMSIRLPIPFKAPLPGPEITKDQLGETVIGIDPRQDTPIGVPIPGLIEAWAANLDTSKEQPDAWIYIVSNYQRFLDEADGGPPPDAFLTDLENELMHVFQVTIPEGETSQVKDNWRYKYQAPPPGSPQAQYATPKDYSLIRFVPEFPVNEKELIGLLCERRVGKTQAAMLVIYPKDAPLQFQQRIDMSLATWNVDNLVPRKAPARAAPGSPPGTATPNQPRQPSGF